MRAERCAGAGVECVLFNEEYMTCMWGSTEMPTVNYSLFYWYKNMSDKVVECKHYLQDKGVRVGCHFKQNELIQFQPFHVLINASVGGKTLEIPSKRMLLQDLVKPEAPVNLTIRNMSNNQLQLTWASPYPKERCLEHAVKYKSNKDTSWTELSVNGDVFSLPSVDYEKSYTFYVRSKINKFCGSTQFWSEWSVPVIWGSNSTSQGTVEEWLHWFGIRTVLVPIASCLLLLVLVILLVRMERVWVILMPRIPNPSKNFDELFITHNGNFQVVKMSSSDPECPQFLFVKVLASRGRLEAVTQQMGYHPQYLDSFLKTQHYLMHMDGPLPFDCRHYIAIMAAARHQCRYLVNLHVLQFLRAGGDPQWLRGLEFIPPKLRNLNEINKILAHRPWLITKEHIEKLLKISEWSWSLAELVHAVVLLAHCHALASFVFGCGCEQDEGLGGRGSLKPLSLGNQCFCEATAGNSYSQELLRINRKRSLDSCMELDSLRERMQRIHVETEGRDEMRLLQQEREEDTDGVVTGATNLACYMQDPDFGYQDFARRDEDQTQVFRVQDYSWEDHGFSLVNRLYSDIGHLLDEKFRMVDGLQSSAMAKRQGCEPSVFKRGIWNYIHCMFGIRYDDYDYAEVNQLLERMLKVYIKTVTCYPEKTNSEMFDRFWKQFKHSEKVHVNLLILEARMQAELLYALQAITQYMIS
ncbi:hypothetical protein DUI87_25243 [Hirundo rustica rustica]|uniref:Fibronectin type-III domain-containing protein n=1 Tax=Hirundo rustica rustica TaxID=333673 RepID=A0A3M0JBR2_HIRRU|nr:hypothetical protein DUI87_25243 [Hirundo rustica rustica]